MPGPDAEPGRFWEDCALPDTDLEGWLGVCWVFSLGVGLLLAIVWRIVS
jgi:hypothetical protein